MKIVNPIFQDLDPQVYHQMEGQVLGHLLGFLSLKVTENNVGFKFLSH